MSTNPKSAGAKQQQSTVQQLGESPLALVAGGVAIGVLVGMLIPRLDKERELLDPLGRQFADRATAAVEAAREAGRAEIESLIPDRDATKDKIGALFGNVIEAAKTGAAQKA